MTFLLFAGFVLASAPAQGGEHVVQLAHRSGPVDARYRGDIAIRQRQIGTRTSAGRPSTWRCAWSADLVVEREARHASGRLSRAVRRDDVLTGTRPGWCSQHKAAIAAEVARRGDEVHAHVAAVAREDGAVLAAEVDRLTERGRG